MVCIHHTGVDNVILKSTVAILIIAAIIGVGWVVLYEDTDFTVSMRVNSANISGGNEIPMDVDVKFESRKDQDIRVDSIQLKIFTERGGPMILRKFDGGFTIPMNGEITRNYQITLENVDQVDDSVYVIIDIQINGENPKHSEREVALDEYNPF